MHKKSQQGNRYSAIKEIGQQRVPLFAENAFRVELHTFQIVLAVANAHDLLRLARAVTSKQAGRVGGSIIREW